MTSQWKARELALNAHAGQVYGVFPYEEHLRAVVMVLLRFDVLEDSILAAAWLHDALEDTKLTCAEIATACGEEVAALVEAVTDEPGANRQERKIKTYLKIRSFGKPAVVLKVADRIANVGYCIGSKDRRLKMYAREFPEFSTALYVPGECEAMWNHLRGLVGIV